METPRFDHLSADDFENVYEPAEDTFFLLDALEKDLEFLVGRQPSVCVEVGPGSGILIAAVAKHTQAFCIGVDISEKACKAAQLTAGANRVSVDLINANLLTCLKPNSVDLLFFNPPYVPSRIEGGSSGELETEIQQATKSLVQTWAGGVNGREVIDSLLLDLNRVMAPEGIVYLLLLKENKPAQVVNQMKKRGFSAEVFMERRIIGEHLFVVKFIKKTVFWKNKLKLRQIGSLY